MDTFGMIALLLILVFSSFMVGVDLTSKHYVKHFGTPITEDLKHDRETCIRSEPVSVPCKVIFVKETNTSNKE